MTNYGDYTQHDAKQPAKTQPKTVKNKKIKPNCVLKLKDDVQGKAGHGTFEISDIQRGDTEFIEEMYLRSKLSEYVGQNFDDVKKDVKKIVKEENKIATKLRKKVDSKKLKNKDGSINPEELSKALGKLEQIVKEKDSKYTNSNYQMAIVSLLVKNFGLIDCKSVGFFGASHYKYHNYVLTDGTIITYNHGKNITVKNPDGQINSYSMDGTKLDNVDPIGQSGIDNAQHDINYANKHKEEREISIAAKQANIDKCPVMNRTIKNGNSMQGLVKNSFGLEVYDFADAQGNQLVGFEMTIADDTNLEFNEKGQLVKLEDPSRTGRHYTFEYDERGNLISAVDKDGWGDIKWQSKIEYDDQNRVIREAYGSPERPDCPFIKEHKY